MRNRLLAAVLLAALPAAPALAVNLTAGMTAGPIKLASVGPIAFAPDGVLLISDPMAATIYAVGTGDTATGSSSANLHIEDVRAKIAGLLGTEPADVQVVDVAVNPANEAVYLAVTRGTGPDAMPVILRTDGSGDLEEVSLADAPHSEARISNAPASEEGRRGNPRMMTITDLAFVDGRVFVAGLSNEEFASKLRSIPFPFEEVDDGASVEIFHGAHGRIETRSPIMTFAPYEVDGESVVLAAYTCTPLVKFRVAELTPGEKVTGETIAELGNRNRPLDMFVYQKDGVNYILMANSSRGVMKISTQEVTTVEQITEPVEGGGTAGLPYETIEALQGILQLDRLNDSLAVALVEDGDGSQNLTTVELP